MDTFVIIKNYRQTQQLKAMQQLPPPTRIVLRQLDANALSMRPMIKHEPKIYKEQDKQNYYNMFDFQQFGQMKYFPTPLKDTLIDYGAYDFNY